jgi:SAM-dependent methyltransferase
MEWFAARYAPAPFNSGISLGCGSGALDRKAVRLGVVRKMVGIDIAPGRLQRAQRRAGGLDLSYVLQDLNTIHLFQHSYDLAVCKMILHHVTRLEHVLDELRSSLLPGALVYVSEYIGPRYFQFPAEMLRIIEEVLRELPPGLRGLQHGPRRLKTRIRPIAVEHITACDPSEAVRSDEIDALLRKYFTVIAERHTGGALLFRLLDGIAHNFDPDNAQHNHILETLCTLEEELMLKRILPEIFKVYVLQNDCCAS